MRKSIFALGAAGAAATLAALALPAASSAEDELPAWQQARAVGEPESCISLSRIRNTVVHSDQVIDFHMRNGDVYRNTLPRRCATLGFEEAFSYSTSLNQLCSTDIITVIRRGGGSMEGPSCGLGQFQQVEFPEE